MIIIRMGTNPEPNDLFTIYYANRAIIAANSHRVQRSARMNLLEVQAGMLSILLKHEIRLPCLATNALR